MFVFLLDRFHIFAVDTDRAARRISQVYDAFIATIQESNERGSSYK